MHRKLLLAVAIGATAVSLAPSSFALPRIGVRPQSFTVSDTDGHDHALSSLAFRGPTLVTYCDKDGCDQNGRVMERLKCLRATDPAFRAVRVIPIVDVARYNAWPKRGFAKKAIREESKEQGVKIYADWHATGRSVLRAESGRSNLYLLDENGNFVWASSGQLAPEQEDVLIEHIRSMSE